MKDLPLFYAPRLRDEGELPEGEAQHALRVLRAQPGDEYLVTDGQGTLFETVVTAADKRHCLLSITSESRWQKYWRGQWSVAIAPTKNIDRIEWSIEKLVELGVDQIYLLRVKHSERKHTKAERIERIIQSAMKQSHKALLPRLIPEITLPELLAQDQSSLRLMAHCREGLAPARVPINKVFRPGTDTLLMVGPEGDFSVEEIQQAVVAGTHPITLGESRLRTETAGLVALQWLHTLDQIDRSTSDR